MNPSYDKDFDSFSSGANAGASQVGGAQPVGGVGGVRSAGEVGGAQPMGGAQPLGPVQQPIVPAQTGDIILKQPEEKKKPRLIFIIFLVVVVILILVGVGIWISRLFKGDGGGNDFGKVGNEYNSYVNYVLFGKDSTDRPDYEAIVNMEMPYFMTLEQNQMEEYLKKATEKYDKFSSVYYENGGEEVLTPLKTYFQDYASIPVLTNEDVLKEYVANGRSAAEQMISSVYNSSDVDYYLDSYLGNARAMKMTYLDIVMKAAEVGCLNGDMMINECYKTDGSELDTYENRSLNMLDSLNLMRRRAFRVIEDIFVENNGEEYLDE